MSEIHKFIKNFTDNYENITSRQSFGLDAFCMQEKIFIVITQDQQIALKIEDYETQINIQNYNGVTGWVLNDKDMQDWYLLPTTFNKKKNKLYPILEMVMKVVLHPKKKKKIKKNKKKSKTTNVSLIAKENTAPISMFKKLLSRVLPVKSKQKRKT